MPEEYWNTEEPEEYWNTEEFAKQYKVKPATVRRSLCLNGHYMGVTPLKMPNYRLLWPKVKPAPNHQMQRRHKMT